MTVCCRSDAFAASTDAGITAWQWGLTWHPAKNLIRVTSATFKSKLLISDIQKHYVNSKFYFWMGISIAALAAGFIILYS